jgi:hypothetical protein
MKALRVAGLGAAFVCLGAGAQDVPATDAWQFEFIPYLWAPGISSDLRLGPLPRSTSSVSSTSVLGALDFGAMGTPTVSFKFGYRYLSCKRDEGLLSQVALGGLFAGAGFRF